MASPLVFATARSDCLNRRAMQAKSAPTHRNGIVGSGLELACNGGSCGGIPLKRDECHLHLKDSPQ